MGTVVLDMTTSLNGCVAGPNDEPEGLHDWFFAVPGGSFVITHSAPSEIAKGDTRFTFVSAGVAEAVRLARAAAGERNAVVGGGGDIARQCLAAGLVDEIAIALRPVVIDGGLQLFERLGTPAISLERLDLVDAPDAIHVRFRIVR